MASILLIMDDLMLLKTTALALEVIGGHEVVEASGIAQGEAYLTGKWSFNLVIVGCSDGDTLEQQIAKKFPSQCIMVCDGQDHGHRSTTCVVKPPETAYELLEPVETILEKTR